MTAYNSVFKRVEKKYRIDVAERAAVEAAAERLMAVDDYRSHPHHKFVSGHARARHDRPFGGKAAL